MSALCFLSTLVVIVMNKIAFRIFYWITLTKWVQTFTLIIIDNIRSPTNYTSFKKEIFWWQEGGPEVCKCFGLCCTCKFIIWIFDLCKIMAWLNWISTDSFVPQSLFFFFFFALKLFKIQLSFFLLSMSPEDCAQHISGIE